MYRKNITAGYLLFTLQQEITVCTSLIAIPGLSIPVLILGPVPILWGQMYLTSNVCMEKDWCGQWQVVLVLTALCQQDVL